MEPNGYRQAFRKRICAIHPEGSPERLPELPEAAGHAILREILETGCLSQNEANILLAREALARVPADWLTEHLPRVAPGCLFQEPEWREWEFCRLGEMLKGPFPEAFSWLLRFGGTLGDPEVEEAVRAFRGL